MVIYVALWMGALFHFCQTMTYTNDWAIRISGDQESANRIAEKYGFTNMGQIGDLKNYYSFSHGETGKRSSAPNENATDGIIKEAKVEWLQQQVVLRRVKRNSRASHIYSIDIKTKHPPATHPHSNHTHTLYFNDPEWNNLWYIHCSDESGGCHSHMNIEGAWRRGHTGKGVVVSVLDDGLDRAHPELKANYDSLASYDVNGKDQDPSPSDSSSANYHGTECAGIIAAAANNSQCTVGVSFHARIGGIRMLDGDVTDIVEAQALSFRPQHIDIYLSSWGPEDDGSTVEGPGPLARLALKNGAQRGRHGRGSIFVWASGNGGRRGDHCSCDGYTNSIYTISISSSTQSGRRPDYQELCSSTLATAYSGGEIQTSRMVTLDLNQGCNKDHSGTSVSSPIAAGIIALALDANPVLTWRDVQHIIVRTSQTAHLNAPDWHVNGAGFKVSHLYGFGLLDAEGMVKEAERWKQLPLQRLCEEKAPIQQSRSIHAGTVVRSVYKSTGCSANTLQHVAYVEHVVVRATIAHRRRGDLSVTLTSPAGTASQLLANRPLDHSAEGFKDWEFMTTHCWGEEARGEWSLEIRDTPSADGNDTEMTGRLKWWTLMLYGTSEQPYASMRREQARSVETTTPDGSSDLAEEYSGPCDPECSDDGCEGPGAQQCVTCLHFFLKFKNNTRTCVSECPVGFWGDRRRCKRCYSSCKSCMGSRRDQCTSCQAGQHLMEATGTCVASCGDGYYLDHDVNTCRKCNENCLKCTSPSICTECRTGTSLQGTRCQRSCAPGFYHSKLDNTCQPCHQACASCAGEGVESCKRCAEGYLMEEWRCVPSCSAGFHAVEPDPEIAEEGQRVCRRCDASCVTCVGAGKGNCSSCSGGHTLQEGVCVVTTVCANGEYQDSGGRCHQCDKTCAKCTGPRAADCIGCASSRALDEGRCVAECAKGKYQSGGQCHLCDHTCATCVDAESCTSCDTDKFGMERYLHKGQCVDACPEALYHTKEMTCEVCSEHCTLCTSLERCLRCNSSYYLSSGACTKLECGEGEVEDPEYDDCMACEEGCRKCVLYNPRHCLSCKEGFYNFQDGCYKHCPAKTYSVEEDMTCVPCDDNCVSCDGHECYWCESDLFLSEGKCVTECPLAFYGDEDTQECEECHSDCVTCDGPEAEDCVTCGEGKKLEDGACVSAQDVCPTKTFRSVDEECEDCHPSCESCSGKEKNQCKTCVRGRFLTAQQMCVTKCPTGSFASRLTAVCESCPQGCSQCVDAQRCTRCQSVRRAPLFLQDGQCVHQCIRGYPVGQVCRSCAPGCASCERNATYCLSCEEPLLFHKHQCVEDCPEGHMLRDGECQHCPAACQQCNALGQCTACEEYHFIHEALCVLDCPESFFEDTDQGVCLQCHSDCTLCDGPDDDDCDSCSDPHATLHNGACLPDCPSHTYRDAMTGECKDCDASCLTCLGPLAGLCTSCRETQMLDGHGHCRPLVNKCPSHHYAELDGGCHPCHKYCHQCSGPGKTHCLSCNQKHLLLNGTCMDDCPTGYYQDEAGQRCEPCHPSCLSCMGKHTHECLTCKEHLFREGKECVDTCQASHYGNTASWTCERCDPSCSECIGGTEDSCLNCVMGLFYLRRQGRCLPTCPPGYYRDTGHRTCEPCHTGCKTCQASPVCDSCHVGYTLSDGMCESSCDVGQYPVAKLESIMDPTTALGQPGAGHACEDCDGSCLECRGFGPANCTMCPAQAILAAGGRCLLCCHHHQGPAEEGEEEAEEEEEGAAQRIVSYAEDAAQQQDCCNCTETRGECILSTNFAFMNEEEVPRGNLFIFITSAVLLVLGLGAVVVLIKRSRSKREPPDITPRGYEKLGSGGRFGGGSDRHGGFTSSSSSYGGRGGGGGGASGSSHYRESQLVDLSDKRAGKGKDEEDEEDEDEDIVYMGQDGTVYRKFRYGQEENEDELEYDDESYAFR